jgi:hypothetical protein
VSEPLNMGSSFRSVGPWNKGLKVFAKHPNFKVWLQMEAGGEPLDLSPDEARRLAAILIADAAAAEAGQAHPCEHCKGADSEERYAWRCFTCKYWLDLVALGVDGRSIICAGIHQRLGTQTERVAPELRGHSGRKARVHYLDGRVVETVDLWYQGEIPQRFRDQLADNVSRVEWVR